jgi:hypothetical protein
LVPPGLVDLLELHAVRVTASASTVAAPAAKLRFI